MDRRLFILANAVGYQLVWLASVAGAGRGQAWAGPVAAAAFLALTLALGGQSREDLRVVAVAVPLGWLLDSGFVMAGWLVHSGGSDSPVVAPLWIACLWMAFALTLNHSLVFLRGRPWLAAALGLVGGPLAYWSAASVFGAVRFEGPVLATLATLAACWALLLPLLAQGRAALPLAPLKADGLR